MGNIFDVGIVGSGVAGTFATYKLAKSHKKIKTLVIECGRPSRKRRSQMAGFLGLLPNSDGQLYLNNLEQVKNITTNKKCDNAYNWFVNETESILNNTIIQDKKLNISLEKRIKKAGYSIQLNDIIQLFPQEIHNLSKFMSDQISEKTNVLSLFDLEVCKIIKDKNQFVIMTEEQEYRCKKLLISVGRSGWRWAAELFHRFGIIINNNYTKFGLRVEADNSLFKDFNNSKCLLSKQNLDIGPFSWNGTIIPEDHFDMAISSFRSNEQRWETDKVSFNLMGTRYFENKGIEQTDRLGQLTFILTNDRIAKEKITTFLNKKSKLSIMSEYDWLIDQFQELEQLIPGIINKGFIHFPTLQPMAPQIKVNRDFSTDIPGLFVAGESAGLTGILSAIVSGIIAGEYISK